MVVACCILYVLVVLLLSVVFLCSFIYKQVKFSTLPFSEERNSKVK